MPPISLNCNYYAAITKTFLGQELKVPPLPRPHSCSPQNGFLVGCFSLVEPRSHTCALVFRGGWGSELFNFCCEMEELMKKSIQKGWTGSNYGKYPLGMGETSLGTWDSADAQ